MVARGNASRAATDQRGDRAVEHRQAEAAVAHRDALEAVAQLAIGETAGEARLIVAQDADGKAAAGAERAVRARIGDDTAEDHRRVE